jgi:hypothetical protein
VKPLGVRISPLPLKEAELLLEAAWLDHSINVKLIYDDEKRYVIIESHSDSEVVSVKLDKYSAVNLYHKLGQWVKDM